MRDSVGAEDGDRYCVPISLDNNSAISHPTTFVFQAPPGEFEEHTRGRLRSFSASAATDPTAGATAAFPFTGALFPFSPDTGRFPFDTGNPLVGFRAALSFRFVMVLEVSDLESSMLRGRAGGIVSRKRVTGRV